MPDIVYKVNDPGMSAVWCVVPAVKAAIATGIVDSANVGLHGTRGAAIRPRSSSRRRTSSRAPIAGAPLTDMVSMYSSVYWNTGSGNMAIFESQPGSLHGQLHSTTRSLHSQLAGVSRQEREDAALILHNDKDGAVDFNQGITFFNTLRQLGKEVVMLQYAGENHGLARPKNMKDYAIRMGECFDHYLEDKPAPDWMKEGVPRLRMEEHLRERKPATKPDTPVVP